MNNVDEKTVAAFRGERVLTSAQSRGGGSGTNGMPVDGTAMPNPEVSALPKRRRFSADYKARVVEEAEGCIGVGGSLGGGRFYVILDSIYILIVWREVRVDCGRGRV